MSLCDEYISKIENIPTVSFNKEQKEIAKKIIKSIDEKDLGSVYNLITQRVKTGFVFDEAPEINHDAVALVKEDESLRIDGGLGSIEHKLIIGENYDALKNLCATYIDKNGKGLIDVIYIDPPYNTEASKADGNDYKEELEASKFIYRDKFTRDGWLNMMNERLKLAKRLLSDSGVIFISIDDKEQAYLKVLCDEIFGENNFIATLPRVTKKSGKDHAEGIAKNHDYVIIYTKSKDNFVFNNQELSGDDYIYEDEFVETRGKYKLNQTLDYDSLWYNENMDFPLDIDEKIFYPGGSEELYLDRHKGNHKPKDWVWRWSKEKFLFGLKNGFIVIKKGKDRERIYTKTYANATISKSRPYKIEYIERKTLLSSLAMAVTDVDFISLTDNVFSNDNGKKEITKIGLEQFDFPKPSALIAKILQIVDNQDAIVLDFFAGSGTTGQAVMELNEEDGGNRQFILVTNNENGIGEKITRERLYRVINGQGSKGEKIAWKYSEDKPYLSNNSVRVFKIENTELKLNDLEKAENLKEQAKLEFKKLNPNAEFSNDFDIYNELSALNPIRG